MFKVRIHMHTHVVERSFSSWEGASKLAKRWMGKKPVLCIHPNGGLIFPESMNGRPVQEAHKP
jgi:hypothetical protein